VICLLIVYLSLSLSLSLSLQRMQRRSRRNKRRTERSISFEYQRRHEDTFRNQPIYRKKSEVNNTERIHFVKKTDIVQESPPTSTTKSTSPRTVTFTPNVDSSISRRRSVDHDRSFRASNSNNSNSTVSPSNQLPGSRRYSALRRSEQQPSQVREILYRESVSQLPNNMCKIQNRPKKYNFFLSIGISSSNITASTLLC
jgi:hypothetical protein